MPHLLTPAAGQPLRDTVEAHVTRRLTPGFHLKAIQVAEQEAYVACADPVGTVRAYVVPYHQLHETLPGGETLVLYDPIPETRNPFPARPDAGFLTLLTPQPVTLPGAARLWRERAHTWQGRVQAAQTGETLLGYYTDAPLGFHYNAPAKAALRTDATRYLKRVLTHLDWLPSRPRAVTFNPAGPGISGEAILCAHPAGHDLGVLVEVGSGASPAPVSENGISIRWTLQSTPGAPTRPFRNHWVAVNTTATDLARSIQAAHLAAGTPSSTPAKLIQRRLTL